MTCEYDYHHTIYDLATIYDLYVPSVLPQASLERRHAPRPELGIAISESSRDNFLLSLDVPRSGREVGVGDGWRCVSGGWISLDDGGCVPWADEQWKVSVVGGDRRMCCLAAC